MSLVVIGSLVTKALMLTSGAGAMFAVEEAPSAAGGDISSLYASISGVIIAGISAFAVIRTSRHSRTDQPDPVPYLVDDEVTDQLTGLYRDAETRAARAEMKAEMWKARALQAGWQEEAG